MKETVQTILAARDISPSRRSVLQGFLMGYHAKNHTFSFPGGKKDETDESLDAAIIREVWEEMDYDLAELFTSKNIMNVGTGYFYEIPISFLNGEVVERGDFSVTFYANINPIAIDLTKMNARIPEPDKCFKYELMSENSILALNIVACAGILLTSNALISTETFGEGGIDQRIAKNSLERYTADGMGIEFEYDNERWGVERYE